MAAVLLLILAQDLANYPEAILVDTRPAEVYEEAHIPGAIQVDVSAFSETRNGARNMLKPVSAVTALVGEYGLDPERHIVIYGAGDSLEDLVMPARLFWILEYMGYPRVSILDGGFKQWLAGDRPAEAGRVAPKPIAPPKLTPREDRLATLEEVQQAIKDGGALLDCRSPAEFLGEKKSDVAKRAGHIPGAQNLPASEYVEGSGMQFKDRLSVRALLEEKGVTQDKPVITYCNSGRSGSVGYFAARLAGIETVAMYDGSMAEWTLDDARPVAAGDETADR